MGTSSGGEPVRVLIVDDYLVFADTLRTLLERDRRIEVVGVAGDAADAIDQALMRDAHVVLMDVSLPDVDGLEATRRLAAIKGDARVIVVSGLERETLADEAREAGAWEFVRKDKVTLDLATYVLEVAQRAERLV